MSKANRSRITKPPQMAAGHRHGRLTAIEYVGTRSHQNRLWRFVCDCGREVVTAAAAVRFGNTSSCGCLKEDRWAERSRARTKHGMRGTPEYRAWVHMRARCQNPNHHAFAAYGGRGITVCEPWESFEAFFADMGSRPPLHSLDRIDNNKGYEPSNCRWANKSTQVRNRRTNRFVDFGGQTLTVGDAAKLAGLNKSTVLERIRRGWTVENALGRPVQPKLL